MIRSDGYRMIGGLVQGARSYDPTSGQWTTPDAFAGDVRDLMSQKPFMWNDNNPVEWSDPSGYCPICVAVVVFYMMNAPEINATVQDVVEGEGGAAGASGAARGVAAKAAEAVRGIEVRASRFGQTAEHWAEAQAAGHPSVLTVNKAGAKSNRAAAMEGQAPAGPGRDRDEYPPAMFSEGGSGASVKSVDASSNRSLGSYIGNQLRKLPNGTRVKIKVTKPD